MTQISCVYSRTATGRLALVFAADLWSMLHGVSSATASSNDQPLHVYLRRDPAGAAAIEASLTKAIGNLTAVEANLVRSDVLAKTNLAPDSIVLDSNHAANGVIVDHNLAFERADLSVLFPCRESTLLGRGNGPILIPFGDGQSVMPAAQVGFAMAKKLDLPVVLYHTTWTVPGLIAADPQAHMCASAQALLKTLQSMAEKSRVDCSVVVETADDVVEGLLHCALRQSARLIVMSRSAKTTIGCYVSQTLRKTPIPLLAIASPRLKAVSRLTDKASLTGNKGGAA